MVFFDCDDDIIGVSCSMMLNKSLNVLEWNSHEIELSLDCLREELS